MTSTPASRSALDTTLAPRSWPSSPGLAMTTRMLAMTAQDVDHAHDIVPAVPAPCVLGQGHPRIGHLAATRSAAQLKDGLDDLGEAGGPDGMPAGQQAAARVDRQGAAQSRLAASNQCCASAGVG